MDRNNWFSKQGMTYLHQDIRNWYKGILAAILYMVIMQFLVGKVCPMVLLTGLPCPACGSTRAGICVMTLQWGKAWQLHPLIFPIGLAMLYAIVCRYVRGCPVYGGKTIVAVLGIMLIVFYFYRMSNNVLEMFQAHGTTQAPMQYWEHNLFRWLLRNVVVR